MAEFLPLADALATNRLQGFIAQAEADGFGVVDRSQFDTLLGTVTGHLPEGQTSRSPVRGLKRGT